MVHVHLHFKFFSLCTCTCSVLRSGLKRRGPLTFQCYFHFEVGLGVEPKPLMCTLAPPIVCIFRPMPLIQTGENTDIILCTV